MWVLKKRTLHTDTEVPFRSLLFVTILNRIYSDSPVRATELNRLRNYMSVKVRQAVNLGGQNDNERCQMVKALKYNSKYRQSK